MLRLAAQMLRRRVGSAVATLVALAAGVMILMAMGVLVESGLRYQPAPQRYAATDLVVAKPELTISTKQLGDVEKSTVALPEGGTVPVALADQVRRVPGVAGVVTDDSIAVTPLRPGAPATVGRPWGSAGLTPYQMKSGNKPMVDDQIVVDERFGAVAPGQSIDLLIGGTAHHYRVSGVAGTASDQPATVFFTDAAAAAFSAHPGRVGAIGVTFAGGANRSAVTAAVGRLARGAGAQAFTGDDRGRAEVSDVQSARMLLIEVGASFGGYVVMLIVFVVAGTVGLSVRHRRRDLALLRAIAATPGQVRRMIMIEAGLLSVVATAIGWPTGLLASHWVHDQLIQRGFIPAGFPIVGGLFSGLAIPVAVTLVAVLAALLAARRVTGIRPTEALGEIAVEPAQPGKVRRWFGLGALAAAVSSSFVTVAADGQAALAGAIGMLYLYVTAVALLAPWINRFAARVLAPFLRAVWGNSGYLAVANLRANARGMATVLTALVLSVGFGGSVWFLQDNLQRQLVSESHAGMLAQRALVSPAGLPADAVTAARAVPGVQAATGVHHTQVIVTMMGDGEAVGAQAVDGAAAATMDLKVRQGNLADLRGDSVAVSLIEASQLGWKFGQTVTLWLGDGTPAQVRVVALYDRGLGFGDLTLPQTLIAGHTRTALDDQILVRTAPGADADAALGALAAQYPGSKVVATADLTGQLAQDLAISAWLNKLLIGVMVGYAALAAANTMVMAALARGRELALLRLVGVTRRQVKRMVHAEQVGLLGVAVVIGGAIAALTLTAVVNTLTGRPVPYVPPLGWVIVLGGATLLALATTILPIARLLRTPPVENIGLRE
jgi:putative ABC transport system permease protein